MKKIVDRKLYDSDKSEFIADWDNGYYSNDFERCEESLYKTKNGSWFIVGAGGPMSRYATSCGNTWSSGSDLIPLTQDAAYQWLEDKEIDSELIKEYFPNYIKEA